MKYGLIGSDLSRSPSKEIHNNLGNNDYVLKELKPEEFPGFMATGDFLGLNVTMPYKKAVMPYCDTLGEEAKLCGNVNTLTRLKDGSLKGDNTDYPALLWCLKKYLKQNGADLNNSTGVICGSGGAGQTGAAALKSLGAKAVILSRDGKQGVDYKDIESYAGACIIINAAPVDIPKIVLDTLKGEDLKLIFDFRYKVELPRIGVSACDGYELLLKQAELSVEIWKDIHKI